MELRGKAHKFAMDNINTDYIIAGKRKFKTLDMKELARYLMEDLDPDFYSKITPGDFLVGGKNFGCGSSREQAPLVILNAGISAVIAGSFARIFYRNAINTGLPVLECDTDLIGPGDELAANLEEGVLENRTTGVRIPVKPLPRVMIQILQEGGLAAHFRKYGTFRLDA